MTEAWLLKLVPVTLALVIVCTPFVALAGAPTADPSDPTRLLGGERLAYQFDARDLGRDFQGQVLDDSPNHVDGTLFGTAASTPGPNGAGNAFPADAVRYVRLDDPSRLANITSDFTVMAWLKPSGYGGVSPVFTAITQNGLQYLNFGVSSQSAFLGWSDSSTNTHSVGSSQFMPYGQWSHVAFVHEGDRLTIVQNNVTYSVTPVPASFYTSSPVSGAYVGTTPFGGYNLGVFAGAIDELRIYDRALHNDEIQSIMTLPYQRPNLPPIANAGGPYAVTCGADGLGHVTLDASGSSDPNGDPFSIQWSAPDAVSLVGADAAFRMGTHAVTLAVSDGVFTTTASTTVRVLDGAPPVLSNVTPLAGGAYAAGQYAPGPAGSGVLAVSTIDASADATDPCTGVASVTFQLDDGAPVVVTSAPFAHSFAPNGVGIQYHTLSVTATDHAGNTSPPLKVDLTLIALAPKT